MSTRSVCDRSSLIITRILISDPFDPRPKSNMTGIPSRSIVAEATVPNGNTGPTVNGADLTMLLDHDVINQGTVEDAVENGNEHPAMATASHIPGKFISPESSLIASGQHLLIENLVGTLHQSPPLEPVAGVEILGRGIKLLFDTVKDLHKLGLEDLNVPLPKIVVVGDQSAGKSSLVEALSEIKVPRDTGTCTRVGVAYLR